MYMLFMHNLLSIYNLKDVHMGMHVVECVLGYSLHAIVKYWIKLSSCNSDLLKMQQASFSVIDPKKMRYILSKHNLFVVGVCATKRTQFIYTEVPTSSK